MMWKPGSGEDADGVGVVVAAGAGSLVEVGGPGVGVVGVAGEVDDRTAELFVGGPAEGDDLDLAGLSRRGGGAGQADQRLRGREAAAGVADLGEKPGGADGAGLRQRGEDRGVGVRGELVGDLLLEGLDLDAQPGQCGDQRQGDLGAGRGLSSGGASGRLVEVVPEPVEVGQVVVPERSAASCPAGSVRASRPCPGWGSGSGTAG